MDGEVQRRKLRKQYRSLHDEVKRTSHADCLLSSEDGGRARGSRKHRVLGAGGLGNKRQILTEHGQLEYELSKSNQLYQKGAESLQPAIK